MATEAVLCSKCNNPVTRDEYASTKNNQLTHLGCLSPEDAKRILSKLPSSTSTTLSSLPDMKPIAVTYVKEGMYADDVVPVPKKAPLASRVCISFLNSGAAGLLIGAGAIAAYQWSLTTQNS